MQLSITEMETLRCAILIVILILSQGCGEDAAPLVSPPPEGPLTKADSVVLNAQILRDALEEWAEANYGFYPLRAEDELYDGGMQFLEFLPDTQLLLNPFSGERTEPTFMRMPGPGEMGYRPLFHLVTVGSYTSWIPIGYRIEAFDPDYQEIITIVVEPDESRVDPRAALLVALTWRMEPIRQALYDYSRYTAGILYPDSLHHELTNGLTLMDFLPNGTLENLVTGEYTEPRDAPALASGQLAYRPLRATTGYLVGQVTGYELSAYVDSTLTIVQRKEPD